MDWWLGFNQCWPMGPKCTVDWDAWALPIAVIAVTVTWLGVLVTGASAVAVYWLGRQANNLALAAHSEAARQRALDASKIEAERLREERVLLCFLLAELQELATSSAAIRDALQLPYTGLDKFVESAEARGFLVETSPWLATDRLEACLGRLHLISEDTGLRLAALLGSCHFVRMRANEIPKWKSPSEYELEFEKQASEQWLTSTYNRLLDELIAAHRRATHCFDKAVIAMNSVNEQPLALAENGGDARAHKRPDAPHDF